MSHELPNDPAATVTHFNPSYLWDMSTLGFAQISVAEPGRLAFLSGQVAGAPGVDVPPDLSSQAEIVATNITNAIAGLGASANDVLMMRMYVVNGTPERFQEALAPLHDAVAGGAPSVTGIGVQSLFTPSYQLEVELVIRVPEPGRR